MLTCPSNIGEMRRFFKMNVLSKNKKFSTENCRFMAIEICSILHRFVIVMGDDCFLVALLKTHKRHFY